MITCERAREQIALQACGGAPVDGRAELAAHLAQCPACAEEAAALDRLAERLRTGLKAWAEAGPAPEDLEQQLRLAVRTAAAVDVAEVLREADETPVQRRRREEQQRREARRTFWTAAAAAAVASLLFLSLPPGQQLAGRVPLVGSVVRFLQGLEPSGAIPVDRAASSGGVTVRVAQVAFSGDATRVTYRFEGLPGGLDGRDARDVAGDLLAGGERLPLLSVALVKDRAGVPHSVEATYAAAPAGRPLAFRLERLPGVAGGPWTVELPAR